MNIGIFLVFAVNDVAFVKILLSKKYNIVYHWCANTDTATNKLMNKQMM